MCAVAAGEVLDRVGERLGAVDGDEVLGARVENQVFLRRVVDADDAVADAAGRVLDLRLYKSLNMAARRGAPWISVLTARWPSPPPAPMMTTKFPDSALVLRSAEYTVTPAHSSGAAAAESRPSGIGVT